MSLKKKKILLISFLTLGYPKLEYTKQLVDALIEGGTDIVELGIPFSDPIADGPVIQYSSQKSLESGTNTDRCFSVIKNLRVNKPVILLTYYNIIYSFGITEFVKKAKKCGTWGILVADLPIDEAKEFVKACRKYRVKTIFIVAPNTSKNRIRKIASKTTGFLYLMAHFGVTGTKDNVEILTLKAVKKIRSITKVPVCVGFGISKGEHVASLTKAGANGAIVGSAYIKRIKESRNLNQMKKKLMELAQELKSQV
ncbi:tryptophan synthase subunit alpha [Candidatus Micrarchaeota archaeon]|nr:tryptophan synthase subunit alpha [Candidatus Micrarchaeota archaeon]